MLKCYNIINEKQALKVTSAFSLYALRHISKEDNNCTLASLNLLAF